MLLFILYWLFLGLAAAAHLVATRVSVSVLARKSDNAWDNAFGYLLVAIGLTWPVRWLWSSQSLLLIALIPPLVGAVSVGALRVIYEVKMGRAAALAACQLALATVAVLVVALCVGIVAAYIIYGRIISDPLFLIRVVLRLIGIEPPF